MLTGPELITFASAAEALNTATGYDVQFVSEPDEAASGAMADADMPPFMVENLIRLFGLLRHGAQEATTDHVRTLTGRRPGSFAEFAKDHAFELAR